MLCLAVALVEILGCNKFRFSDLAPAAHISR